MRPHRVHVIGLGMPVPFIREIDALADRELISRASWLRRAVLKQLEDEKAKQNNSPRRQG